MYNIVILCHAQKSNTYDIKIVTIPKNKMINNTQMYVPIQFRIVNCKQPAIKHINAITTGAYFINNSRILCLVILCIVIRQ